jgi:hypothetical protein
MAGGIAETIYRGYASIEPVPVTPCALPVIGHIRVSVNGKPICYVFPRIRVKAHFRIRAAASGYEENDQKQAYE